MSTFATRIQRMLKDAEALHDSLQRGTTTTVNIESRLTEIATEFTNIADDMRADIDDLVWLHAPEVWPGIGLRNTGGVLVDVDNGASKGTITFQGSNTTAWNVFDVNDVVTIFDSENGNDGDYTVSARSTNVLTMTAVISGNDTPGASIDNSLKVRLKTR